MEEAHTIIHQIITILGIKQCTATQILGICIEFWVGGAVAIGLLKVKNLLGIKKQFEELQSTLLMQEKPKKKKKKKKKK